jgi:hypothetical protein
MVIAMSTRLEEIGTMYNARKGSEGPKPRKVETRIMTIRELIF